MEQNPFFEIETFIFETKKAAHEGKLDGKLCDSMFKSEQARWKLHVIDNWWLFEKNGYRWKLFLKINDSSYVKCWEHAKDFQTQKLNWRKQIWESEML